MNVQELKRSMEKKTGNAFITRPQLKEWFGCGSDKAAKITKDLDYIPGEGKGGNRYLCSDVAKALAKNIVRN